jgi:hypothetical protein
MTSVKKIFWAVLAKDAESTLSLYLDCLYRQEYDRKAITLYFRTNDNRDNTEQMIDQFVATHGDEYRRVLVDNTPVDSRLKNFENHEWNPFRFSILGAIRNESLRLAIEDDCDFYFVSDVDNFIIPQTLSALVDLNLEVVAPLLYNARSEEAKKKGLGSGEAYSNFHCDIDEIGGYLHSHNYLPILNRDFIGIHEVPLVHCTYLIRRDAIDKVDYLLEPSNYEYRNFSISASRNNVKQYLDNRLIYGYLTLLSDAETARDLLPSLEWFATDAKSISYKVFNCGTDEIRNQNAANIRHRFTKHLPELVSQTVLFSSVKDVRDFLAKNKEFNVLSNRDYPGWRLGAIGIWASWFKAFQAFNSTDKQALIVLEDDLWFRDEIFQKLPQVFQGLPDDWDYVTMFSPENEWHLYKGIDIDSDGVLTTPFATWSCAAVAFSKQGVEKILRYMSSGISQHCDLFLYMNDKNNLKGFALSPEAMRDKISVYMNWKSSIGLPNTELLSLKDISP